MPEQLTAQLSRPLLAAALCLLSLAHAQAQDLYKVEMLVFSQPAGAGAEHWEAIPELTYPSQSHTLTYPGEKPPSTAQHASTSIPERGAPTDTIAPAGPLLAATFATLPSAERQFSGNAAAMQRSGRYRILFHEAWLQPMTSRANTLPIVLDRSGDGGAWPALQGSIKVYLSRYLYLDANLWLNTQGEYLSGEWRMPAPPLAPISSAREVETRTQQQQTNTTTPGSSGYAQARPAESGLESESLAPEYPFRHAVLLKQTRRMSSGDTVYVDHPLLGILIKITPVAAN